MDVPPFDTEIRDVLEGTYQAALLVGGSSVSPDRLKLMILAANMEALAKTFLMADSKDGVTLDLKQVALGVLGSVDWIKESFPEDQNDPDADMA